MQQQELHRTQNSKEKHNNGEQTASTGREIVDNLTEQRFRDQTQISGEEEMHPYSR